MYTPLRYMEQVSNMVTLPGARSLEGLINRKCVEYFNGLIESNRSYCLLNWVWLWNKFNGGDLTDEEKDFASVDKRFFEENIGLAVPDMADFYHQALSYMVLHDWSRSKRVYKVESSMMHDLCEMKIPDTIPVTIFTNLPSKCFYIDYGENQHFCQDAVGCFVMYDVHEGHVTYDLVNIVEHNRCIPIHTNCAFRMDGSTPVSGNIAGYREKYDVELEDGTSLTFYEREFVRFVFNFFLYLNAANADVEYTERTKQIYKKPKAGAAPKNRMSEIEELGVGYRYSTPVSLNRKKVKYVGGEDNNAIDEEKVKRGYSSNYRCAHWHHFWVNDKDNPGKKVLIVKWVKETYVHGNKTDDKVIVHNVTK